MDAVDKENCPNNAGEGLLKAFVCLASPRSTTFSHVIVYYPRYNLTDGTYTSFKGCFKVFPLEDLALSYPINDFYLEKDMYQNSFGTLVKPIGVKHRRNMYLEAYLFARIRVNAQMVLVNAIASRLNRQLEIYQDNLRDGIGQEWCAQEQWRIFPRFAGMIHPVNTVDGSVETLREIMADLLPRGYDDDWKMRK